MDTSQLKYLLEELHFSAGMPSETLGQLAAESKLEHAPAGTVLFREGSRNRNRYLIRSGWLALEMNVPGRGTVRILTLGTGDMAGWSALLDQGKMMASALAVQDSEVIVAAADKLRQLCETNHDFGYHLMRQMAAALSKRLVATRLQLLELFADAPPFIPTREREDGG